MEKKDGPFSPFEPITIKLLMSPPNMHFINLPLAVSIFLILNKIKTISTNLKHTFLRYG